MRLMCEPFVVPAATCALYALIAGAASSEDRSSVTPRSCVAIASSSSLSSFGSEASG